MVQIPILPLTSSVTLGEALSFPLCNFLICSKKIKIKTKTQDWPVRLPLLLPEVTFGDHCSLASIGVSHLHTQTRDMSGRGWTQKGRREHGFSKMGRVKFRGSFTGLLRAFKKQMYTVGALSVNYQLLRRGTHHIALSSEHRACYSL